ncbi:MAG: ABC transporter ATP-binding protein [Candidatus Kariarchaeaceae archaeon]
MPEIQFYEVSKYYGPVKAVEDLNFTIYDGEYLSLLGPSGCGKTTTLRILSGLILPSKGKILWDGKPVESLTANLRDIGYVFQQFAIFPHLDVWSNIAFGPEVKGLSSLDIEDTVEQYIKLVGLEEKANVYPHDLNAADLQRVGIARVLATGATTLLLDEPMGALDQKVREQFQDEIRLLVKKLKLTAIHVTHDQSEAMAISDRIGVMKKGKMIQLGTPRDLLFNPTQIFTAHFIGEADFLEGIVTETANSTIKVELIGDEIISLPKSPPIPVVGQRVIVGVRREFFKVRLTSEHKEKRDINTLHGTVLDDRFIGEKRRTRIQLEYGRKIEVKRYASESFLATGELVEVHVPENGAFLFRYPSSGLEVALSVT